MKTTRREERLEWRSQKYRDKWIRAEIKGIHKILEEREKQTKDYNEAQKLRNAGLNNERAESRLKEETFANKDIVQMLSDRQKMNEGRSSGYTGLGLTIRDIILAAAALTAIYAGGHK